MPVYFFHLRAAEGHLRPDHDGRELEDDVAALRKARSVAADLASHAPHALVPVSVEIHDGGGWHVETVPVPRPWPGTG